MHSFVVNVFNFLTCTNATTNDISQNHDSTLNIWRVSGNGINIQQQDTAPQFLLNQSGNYNLSLKVSNSLGCSDSVIINSIIQVFHL